MSELQQEAVRPSERLRVRPRWRAYLDAGRRLERAVKYHLRRGSDGAEYEPAYAMIAERYPRLPTAGEAAELLRSLQPRTPPPADERRVFQYWHQGRTPQLAARRGAPWHPVHVISALSYERYAAGHHLVLDQESLDGYLSVPRELLALIEGQGRYPMLADVVRCMLLFVHGGVWSDLTVCALNAIPGYVWEHDFFVHVRAAPPPRLMPFRYFDWHTHCWDPGHKVRITPGFMRCTPGHELMGRWLLKFMEVIDGERERLGDLHYYIFMIVFDYLVRHDPDFAEAFERLSRCPSDAWLHYLVIRCAAAFSEREYRQVREEHPIQRIKLSTRLFRGCLAYETLRREGW